MSETYLFLYLFFILISKAGRLQMVAPLLQPPFTSVLACTRTRAHTRTNTVSIWGPIMLVYLKIKTFMSSQDLAIIKQFHHSGFLIHNKLLEHALLKLVLWHIVSFHLSPPLSFFRSLWDTDHNDLNVFHEQQIFVSYVRHFCNHVAQSSVQAVGWVRVHQARTDQAHTRCNFCFNGEHE